MRAVKGEHAVCVSLCGLAGYGAGYSFFNASAGFVLAARMLLMDTTLIVIASISARTAGKIQNGTGMRWANC